LSGFEVVCIVVAAYGSILLGVPLMVLCLSRMGYNFQMVIEKNYDLNQDGWDDDDGDWDEPLPDEDGGGGTNRLEYMYNPEYYDWMNN